MVAHAVLPLKALLADGTGIWFLIRVGQPVAIQVVHIPERLPTCLACMILPNWIRNWVRAGVWVEIGIRARRGVRVCNRDRDLD